MPYDYDEGVNPTQVPQDEEEQRRRALLTMPPVPLRPIGLQTSAHPNLPGPLADLVRNPRNLLMPPVPEIRPIGRGDAAQTAQAFGLDAKTMAPVPGPGIRPLGSQSRDLMMRTGQDPRAVPLPQPVNAPSGGVALNDSGNTMAAIPGISPIGGRRTSGNPGNDLLLSARADAASRGAISPSAEPQPWSESLPMDRMPGIPGIGPISPMPNPRAALPGETELQRLQRTGSGVSLLTGKKGTLARIADAAGSIIAPNVMAAIPGTTLHNRALQGQEAAREEQQGKLAQQDLERRNVQSEIADRDRRAQPDNPEDKKLDAYVNDQGQQTIIFQKPDGSTYEKSYGKVEGKQEKISNPFEAFAYGTPQERQAAKDFIEFENQNRAKNDRPEKPGEIEQRYQLYLKDPEAYKAMFGDRGAAQDQTQAARMLKYFDGQRRRIEQDWTLDEPTRSQQLSEIDQLEKPYLDTAGGAGDRVTVISPAGVQGTIPRSQLPAAQKKGYKVAQ